MKIIIEGNSYINERDQNQDVIGHALNRTNNYLILLADGMGGHSEGQLCASFFVENFINHYKRSSLNDWENGNPFQWIEKTLYIIKKDLVEYVRANKINEDMGTTMVGAILINWTLFCFNVGDSRCYVLTDKEIKLITKDQIIGNYPDLKHLGNPMFLTSALGPLKEATIDFSYLVLNKDTNVLLTSDGVHGVISDKRIHELIMKKSSRLKVRTQILINETRIMGGKDNASCICMEFN